MKKISVLVPFLISTLYCIGQSFPNSSTGSLLSSTNEMAQKISSTPVNLFTGLPDINLPIYSYNDNGLNLNISLSYFPQGVKPRSADAGYFGINWALNAGGSITRNMKGGADDGYSGFLNSDSIPNDYRNKADSLYNEEKDPQQDIFYYRFNGISGKFVIGKNKQIIQIPLTARKIIPIHLNNNPAEVFEGFIIIMENGVKYFFKDFEESYVSELPTLDVYKTAWNLSKIVSAFSTDSITFNYSTKASTKNLWSTGYLLYKNSDQSKVYKGEGNYTNNITSRTLQSVSFPNKETVMFDYATYTKPFTNIHITDGKKIKKSYKYILKNSLLDEVIPYTASLKHNSYRFEYYNDSISGSFDIRNSIDYWGFYNGVNNDSLGIVPPINGIIGADRNPEINHAVYRSLKNAISPDGGIIQYEYELNDHYPYTIYENSFNIDPKVSGFPLIMSLNQVFGNRHQFEIMLNPSVNRQGTTPISGSGKLDLIIKNGISGPVVATITISLYDLFLDGFVTKDFISPNGDNYIFTYNLSAGTTISGNFPIIFNFQNRFPDNTKSFMKAGGLRIKKITKKTSVNDPSGIVEEYRYVTEDGKSSGFLGDVPKYDYQYSETLYGDKTDYTVISTDPQMGENVDLAGYSRVEVFKGSVDNNLGKTVYEFTSPNEVNINLSTTKFPYLPRENRMWELGLPKSISVYNNAGILLQKTTNQYKIDSLTYNNKYFRSLKLGRSAKLSTSSNVYLAGKYFVTTGRSSLSDSYDTVYNNDGSKLSSYSHYFYDTNYNVVKIVNNYQNGLEMERRFYYPYNYTISGGIGKLRDSGIINTLVSSESWITGDGNSRIVSGSITDFKILSTGEVKPSTVYTLASNKPVTQSLIGLFNPSKLNRNSSYFIPITNFINYDKGKLVESNNAQSGISSTIIYDYNNYLPIASVSNSVLKNVAYTSFEADGKGNWTTIAGASRDSLNAVTGYKSYNLSNGEITKTSLTSSKTYLITVWAKAGATLKINNVVQTTPVASQNGWNLFSKLLTGYTTVTISGIGLIDELRLHPKEANMNTSTFEPLVGVTSETDANNTIVYYEYDALNRLKTVRDKDKNIIKHIDYSDSLNIISSEPLWVFIEIECRGNGDGSKDSVFVDSNIFSDSYNTGKRVTFTTDLCNCSYTTPEDYRIVNGQCEMANEKCYTQSVYVKIMTGPQSYYWAWVNVWHYKWSDGSIGIDHQDEETFPQPLGCLLLN